MHSRAVSPFRLDEYILSVYVIASNVDFPSVWVSRVTKENQSHFGNSVWVSALLVMFACLVSVSRACTRVSTTSNFWNESKPFGVFLFAIILVSTKQVLFQSTVCQYLKIQFCWGIHRLYLDQFFFLLLYLVNSVWSFRLK